MNRKMVYFLLSAIICFAVLYYIFKEISLSQVWELLINAEKNALLIFLGLSMTMSYCRMLRYKLLLNFAGHKPGSFSLFCVVLIRNFCSDLLPARLGSLIYVFLLNKRLGVSLDQATSSFSLALVFDICSVAPLVLLATLFLGESAGISNYLIIGGAGVFLIFSFFLIYFTPMCFKIASLIVDKLVFIPEKIRLLTSNFFDKVNKDIRQVKDAGLYTKVFVLSIVIRALKYTGLYFVLYALLSPEGYTYSMLPWAKVFFGMIVPEFVASLPVSGIGGFGAYQGAWVFMFEMLKFPSETAKLTSISHHLLTQAYGVTLAAISLFLLLLPFPRGHQVR